MNFKYYNEIIDKIVALKQQGVGSRTIANQLNIGKSTVNQYYAAWLELESQPEDVSEQEDKSFDDNLNVLCEHSDYSVSNLAKRLRHAHRTNNQLRKIQREITDTDFNFKEMLIGVEKAVDKVQVSKYSPRVYPAVTSKQNGVVEVLFSDWQIGKVAQHYNTEVIYSSLLDVNPNVFFATSNVSQCLIGEKGLNP